METSLQNPNYQGLPPKEAYKEMLKLIERVKRFNGVFVLLWHNFSFDPLGGWAGWKEAYEKVMKYISKQNAFVSSGKEIINWWSKRLEPVQGDGSKGILPETEAFTLAKCLQSCLEGRF